MGSIILAILVAIGAFAVLLRSGIPRPAQAGREHRPGDAIGLLVVTQLVGLLLSPISWSHHWVWVIVLAVWLVHGPQRGRPGARLLLGYWAVVAGIGVPWLLTYLQPSIWLIERPLWQAILGSCFTVGALATLLWIALAGRRDRFATGAREDATPTPGKLSSARRAPTSSRPPAAT